MIGKALMTRMKAHTRYLWWLLSLGVVGGVFFFLPACKIGVATGEIAGTVTDIAGDPVRGADIFLNGRKVAQSSPVGTFVVRNVPEGEHEVRASLVINGVPYRGRNRVVVFPFERTTSVGIVVGRQDQMGGIRGWVEDEFGNRLRRVRVFAGAPLNSWMAITRDDGTYEINDLIGGFRYTVTASGRGYENDTTTVDVLAGQTHTVNFRLRLSRNQNQNAPQNLSAIAWTSPVDPNRTRDRSVIIAYESLKRLLNPERTRYTSSTRGTFGLAHIEIDLTWDYQYYSELLGYGIYRGTTSGNILPLDVLRDPLANFYADISDDLRSGVRYYYQVTRLNTDFPERPGSESPRSNIASAVPLPDLFLLNPLLSPLQFFWVPVVGADEYQVFLFPQYPNFQVSPIWSSARTPNSSILYNGPPLVSGRRYYYVVVGFGHNDTSFTISQIDSFVAP
jgi:hypothetical protein